MASDTPPEELQTKLPHDPRLWARNFLRHPNDPSRPYDFYDGEGDQFLYYLVDDQGPMNPEQWGDINVLLFCRGGLKTWSVSTIDAWATDMYPSLEAVATAPTDDQRGEVVDRFKNKVDQSGMVSRRVKDNERHQKFKNQAIDEDTGETYPAYSHLKSRTAWNEGNKLRGLHGHVGVMDESQDIDEGTFSTFLEAIDRGVPSVGYFPTIFVIGTPKLAGTFFQRLWQMSDQKTWDRDEKEWIVQEEANEFLPAEMQKKKEDLEDKLSQLQERIEDADNPDKLEDLRELRDQFEDKLDGIQGFEVRGWHLDQHNSPLHDDMRVAFKKETYSEKKFKNEVEARFHRPENNLLNSDHVWDAMKEDMRMEPAAKYPETKTYLGVDWGGGQGEGAASTVITVGEEVPGEYEPDEHPPIEVRKVDVLDPGADERQKVADYMDKYDVDLGVVDEGWGETERKDLQDEYGFDTKGTQTVYGCWFGNVTTKEEVTWNRHNDQKRFFTSSKSYTVRSMAQEFKQGTIVLPQKGLSFDNKQSLGTRIVEELTAPYLDKKETSDGKTKTKVKSDRNDDIFMSVTYLWIAARMVGSERTLRSITTHDMPGH